VARASRPYVDSEPDTVLWVYGTRNIHTAHRTGRRIHHQHRMSSITGAESATGMASCSHWHIRHCPDHGSVYWPRRPFSSQPMGYGQGRGLASGHYDFADGSRYRIGGFDPRRFCFQGKHYSQQNLVLAFLPGSPNPLLAGLKADASEIIRSHCSPITPPDSAAKIINGQSTSPRLQLNPAAAKQSP
jgi:hypothetical protein